MPTGFPYLLINSLQSLGVNISNEITIDAPINLR